MSVDDYISDPNNNLDLTDNIVDYLEDCIGKYHLTSNWQKMRGDMPALKKITQTWLTRNNLSYNVDEFIDCANWYINRHKQVWSWAY